MVAHNALDLSGQHFGQLLALGRAAVRAANGQVKWLCRCLCGTEAVVVGAKLRSGHTKSCGCLKHRTGLAAPTTDKRPVLERLSERSHIDPATGCKLWDGTRTKFGHGIISVLGVGVQVHRVAWEAERGSIPDGIDCLHNCPGGDNPACWNVDHLWLGTQGDNNADRDRKGRHISLPGMQHGCARLTDDQVIAIRSDDRSYREIADAYGIAEAHVGSIIRGDNWKHLPLGAQKKRRGRSGARRLTATAVRVIQRDGRRCDEIASEHGVSTSRVYQIKRAARAGLS